MGERERRPYAGPPIAPTEVHSASFGSPEMWAEMHIAHEIVKWRAKVENRRYDKDEVLEGYARRKVEMSTLCEENERLRGLIATRAAGGEG